MKFTIFLELLSQGAFKRGLRLLVVSFLAVFGITGCEKIEEIIGVLRVNCDAGGSLAAALNRADPGDRIVVSGTCNVGIGIPPIIVKKDGIIIDGGGTAILDGNGISIPVITFDDVQDIIFRDFTARNGQDGIVIRNGSKVAMEGITTIDNDGDGLLVSGKGSSAYIGSTEIGPRGGTQPPPVGYQDVKRAGLAMARIVGFDAHAATCTFTASGNGNCAVHYDNQSSGNDIVNCNKNLTDNDGSGLCATNESTVTINGATISMNNSELYGMALENSSKAIIKNGSTVHAKNTTSDRKQRRGISVIDGSTLEIIGWNNIRTENNNTWGLYVGSEDSPSSVLCTPESSKTTTILAPGNGTPPSDNNAVRSTGSELDCAHTP